MISVCNETKFTRSNNSFDLTEIRMKFNKNGSVKSVMYNDHEMKFSKIRGQGTYGRAIEYEYEEDDETFQKFRRIGSS